jgi:hypothetical protein
MSSKQPPSISPFVRQFIMFHHIADGTSDYKVADIVCPTATQGDNVINVKIPVHFGVTVITTPILTFVLLRYIFCGIGAIGLMLTRPVSFSDSASYLPSTFSLFVFVLSLALYVAIFIVRPTVIRTVWLRIFMSPIPSCLIEFFGIGDFPLAVLRKTASSTSAAQSPFPVCSFEEKRCVRRKAYPAFRAAFLAFWYGQRFGFRSMSLSDRLTRLTKIAVAIARSAIKEVSCQGKRLLTVFTAACFEHSVSLSLYLKMLSANGEINRCSGSYSLADPHIVSQGVF